MSEPREMTAEALADVLRLVERHGGADDAARLYEHITALTVRANGARDAALEEAAKDMRTRADAAQEFGSLRVAEVWRNAESACRALKSRPAEPIVSVAKVREVLKAIKREARGELDNRPMTATYGTLMAGRIEAVNEAANAIGLDLDE